MAKSVDGVYQEYNGDWKQGERRVIMRTIPEVAEDFKSILNNIERTEECTGETLVDINELVDEVLTINCYKDKPKSKADHIRAMSDEELAKERIDRIDIYTKSDSKEYIGDFEGIANSEEEAIKKELEWLQSEAEQQKGAICGQGKNPIKTMELQMME